MDMVVFLAILASLVFLGLWDWKKVRTEDAYLMANRKLNTFALTATLVMTEFNTSTLIAFSGMGYIHGAYALFLPTMFLAALIFYAFTVAEKWKDFNGLSVAQWFTKRYGSAIGKLVSLMLLSAMAVFSATYVKSITVIFEPFFPKTSFEVLSLLIIALVLLITLRRGLTSIVYTDILSFCLICLFFPGLLFFAKGPIMNVPLSAPPIISPWFLISTTVLMLFTYISAPWYGQKIFAAKTKKVAKNSAILASLIVFVLYAIGVLATMQLRGTFLAHHEDALSHIIYYHMPVGIRGLGYFLLFSAAATTLAGVWNAMAAMAIGDFLSKTQSKDFKRGLFLTLSFGLISYILANIFIDEIFSKLILANIPVLALSFALLGGFYWNKASKAGAFASIFTGLFWGIFSYLFFGEGYLPYWVLGGLPLIFLSGFLGSKLVPDMAVRVA